MKIVKLLSFVGLVSIAGLATPMLMSEAVADVGLHASSTSSQKSLDYAREAWAETTARFLIDNSGAGALMPRAYEDFARKLRELPPGSEVFIIPGLKIRDGSDTWVERLAKVERTANGFEVYSDGRPVRPVSSKATFSEVKVAEWILVRAGHRVPSRFASVAAFSRKP